MELISFGSSIHSSFPLHDIFNLLRAVVVGPHALPDPNHQISYRHDGCVHAVYKTDVR
jgi:hypothetical protein